MSREAHCDVVILGAGAAGLMCAATAGKRGRRVVVLDHGATAGRKILVSGGGRCNFTNRSVSAADFITGNQRFPISALARYTPADICALLDRRGVPWVEESGGRRFCRRSSRDVLAALLAECAGAGVTIGLPCGIRSVDRPGSARGRFAVQTDRGRFEAPALVVATGGISYPKLGATDLGLRIAKQFRLRVEPPRPALVALSWNAADRRRFAPLSGIAVDAGVCCGGRRLRGSVLFTHRGLSGPAILDASAFWTRGEAVVLDLLPGEDAASFLARARAQRPKAELRTILAGRLPKRLAEAWCAAVLPSRPLREFDAKQLRAAAAQLTAWKILPSATEGFARAEAMAGGVDTVALSSKTMEAQGITGLFFVGEVMDVTGMLGGFNLHWAWASGYAAGMAV